jgi:hypothetical protein
MVAIRIFLLVYQEFAVIRLRYYVLHTKSTCIMFLARFVTRFCPCMAVIVFLSDNTPCMWCITSQAPPVPRERVLTLSPPPSLPPCIDLATCLCLHGYRWSTFLSDLSFHLVKQTPFLLLPTIGYRQLGEWNRRRNICSEVNWVNIRCFLYKERILNVLTSHLIFNNRHTEKRYVYGISVSIWNVFLAWLLYIWTHGKPSWMCVVWIVFVQ